MRMRMRGMLAVFVAAAAFFTVAKSTVQSAPAPANEKEEVLQADEARNQALQKNDIEALSKIYADDLVYANATGALLSKQQHLAELKNRGLNFKSFKHDDVQAVVRGDVGMVTGISTSAVEYHGELSTHPRRFLNVFQKRDGKWLCVAHFETEIKQQ